MVNKQIWHSKQVPKIRVFLWRLWNKSLPFPEQKATFLAAFPSRCPLCKADCATEDHVLLLCPLANSIWSFFGSSLIEGGKKVSKIKNEIVKWWISFSGKSMTTTYFLILPGVIVWHIWKAFWDANWNDIVIEKDVLIRQICTYMLNWCYANEHLRDHERLKEIGFLPSNFGIKKPRILNWRKPKHLHVKLNWAVFRQNGKSSAGFLLRDHDGAVVAAKGFPLSGSTEEEDALRMAVEWIVSFGLPFLEIEVSSSRLVECCNTRD
ncbi:unnamed protein product [Cuscuta europaea]|uniref:Reverse transcriptase zinc-binding domain-containing protein n=1 Tax=Cuscuta europaea TaxID=41803 RepID=A0A9P1E812_CUSEU|nr:unnamed protein product [Cuscuta europaea]